MSFQVSEMAVSELPGNPNAVWTVRRHVEGKRPIHIVCVHAHELCRQVILQAFLWRKEKYLDTSLS